MVFKMMLACILYSLRVLAAWWLIAQIRTWITLKKPSWSNWVVFYTSVLIGAEITFIIDYGIFNGIVFNG
jgi:TRAP-type C4-dicarboxylate transport system permease large subunit